MQAIYINSWIIIQLFIEIICCSLLHLPFCEEDMRLNASSFSFSSTIRKKRLRTQRSADSSQGSRVLSSHGVNSLRINSWTRDGFSVAIFLS